jgi:hypothetical protein
MSLLPAYCNTLDPCHAEGETFTDSLGGQEDESQHAWKVRDSPCSIHPRNHELIYGYSRLCQLEGVPGPLTRCVITLAPTFMEGAKPIRRCAMCG